jgi:hypothetical protein
MKFNMDSRYRVILIDLGEDLSNIRFDKIREATLLFGEVYWDLNKIMQAENIV